MIVAEFGQQKVVEAFQKHPNQQCDLNLQEQVSNIGTDWEPAKSTIVSSVRFFVGIWTILH